ncbi:MAG: hypothetical protein RXR01_03195 [Thermoproteus sp.]|jgi:hypothetical protein
MAPMRADFDRKVIHILAGGLVALLLTPFSSWVVPVSMAFC